MDVGFVGLGQMGTAMVLRMSNTGHRVVVWNRSPEKSASLFDQGIRVVDSPLQAAASEIVFTMLANDAALEDVVDGNSGIFAAGEGVFHVSCSTVSVALTARLAAEHRRRGQRFVSAPVFGRPEAAAAGQLAIICAGAAADLARCVPLFEAVGNVVIQMGHEPVMAAAVKLAANLTIAAMIQTLAEANLIASANGVTFEKMIEFFRDTDFGSRIVRVYAIRSPIWERRYLNTVFVVISACC